MQSSCRPLGNKSCTKLRIRPEIFNQMNPNWVRAFQLVVSNDGQRTEGDERGRVRESGTDRERERDAEKETQLGMKRTNSASIVYMAWLTF